MELSRILITEHGDQQMIFLREVGGQRGFPIVIGVHEALAIDRRLKGIETPRPMTHDLLAGVIEAMGGRIDRIVISDLRDHTFVATLHIELDGRTVEVDSRPSDAIALGAALQTPIFVADHVLSQAANSPTTKQQRLDILRDRLAMLRQAMEALESQLADEDFLGETPPELIEQLRQQLVAMASEHDDIEQVLKKYS
jgi:bifunctional DNase/RNase